MSHLNLRLTQPTLVPHPDRPSSLGRHLVHIGAIEPWQLFQGLEKQNRWDATLGEILHASKTISQDQLLDAYAARYGALRVDLNQLPADQRLAPLLSPAFCLKHAVLPWMTLGGLVVLATSRPDRFNALRDQLPKALRHSLITIAPEAQIRRQIAQTHRRVLTKRAEARVTDPESCRSWNHCARSRLWLTLTAVLVLAAAFFLAPTVVATGLMGWALFTLICSGLLKYIAFLALAHRRYCRPRQPVKTLPDSQKLPRISVLVPLFKETEIATALIHRLSKLTYPKALLDVILVLEEQDELTHQTIALTRLPNWISVVEVPAGSGLTTKPRALNYALDFCKGDIIGIWDAEDAPAPNQLERVAERFASAPANTVCLQGILDYYNPDATWVSRCFTIEYATWFRIVLPGLSHLGLAIPLGGTTLFMRRAVLDQIGGWDAHNVTEDADLGIRLARYGYRTELINTVTKEEANCRPWPWIKQRSRWLKGYMVTYLVHMRAPLMLRRQLGWRQFLGVQLIFVTTVLQFLLAPLIWTFWLIPLDMPHSLRNLLGADAGWLIPGLFLTIFLLDLVISLSAVWLQKRRRLMPWAGILWLYFPLATLAAYKALFELIFRPFFWDKTAHGHSLSDDKQAP